MRIPPAYRLHGKLGSRAEPGLFLGYEKKQKHYRVLVNGKIIVSETVKEAHGDEGDAEAKTGDAGQANDSMDEMFADDAAWATSPNAPSMKLERIQTRPSGGSDPAARRVITGSVSASMRAGRGGGCPGGQGARRAESGSDAAPTAAAPTRPNDEVTEAKRRTAGASCDQQRKGRSWQRSQPAFFFFIMYEP